MKDYKEEVIYMPELANNMSDIETAINDHLRNGGFRKEREIYESHDASEEELKERQEYTLEFKELQKELLKMFIEIYIEVGAVDVDGDKLTELLEDGYGYNEKTKDFFSYFTLNENAKRYYESDKNGWARYVTRKESSSDQLNDEED